MNDPFLIDGPALISFSGGRTSGYMLRRILDAGLRPDVHVLFCNTGKEDDRTLDFVNACSQSWGVPIRWLEYRRRYLPAYKSPDVAETTARIRVALGFDFQAPPPGVKEPGFVEVTYKTAARTLDPMTPEHPFTNLIAMSGVPNAATRLCSTEMKTRIMGKFMRSQGYEHWTNVVGIRADEPRRVRRMRIQPPERWENEVPLADAGVNVAEVLDFWARQPFDLALANDPTMSTYQGNCDLCMLKTDDKKVRLERETPGAVSWWETVEAISGSTFRPDRPYKTIHRLAVLGVEVRNEFEVGMERIGMEDPSGCMCHD